MRGRVDFADADARDLPFPQSRLTSGSSGHKTTARAAAARIADGVLMGAHECGAGADMGYCWPSAVTFSAVALAW